MVSSALIGHNIRRFKVEFEQAVSKARQYGGKRFVVNAVVQLHGFGHQIVLAAPPNVPAAVLERFKHHRFALAVPAHVGIPAAHHRAAEGNRFLLNQRVQMAR